MWVDGRAHERDPAVHSRRLGHHRHHPRARATHGDYEHNRLNHDTNSHAHIRAAIVGASETIPLREGRLGTGTWQQIVLVDFDDSPRQRTVVVQIVS